MLNSKKIQSTTQVLKTKRQVMPLLRKWMEISYLWPEPELAPIRKVILLFILSVTQWIPNVCIL